ncbi:MAG: hypothetical protein ABIU63_11505 [Chitinophagaceae bacterium]
MEDNDIIRLWQSYTKKLDDNLVLSRENAAAITKLKIHSFLSSMKPYKIFSILVGLAWVAWVDVLIISLFHIANPFFLVSAIMQVLLTKIAIGLYLYQLVLIHQTDVSEPVLNTQHKLARLKSSTIWVARILFLQLPVWTTFYWNKSMLANGNLLLYILQLVVTLFFTILAVWLFNNIRYENRNKKWFGLIFNGQEWNPVIKSIELLHQIADYRIEK